MNIEHVRKAWTDFLVAGGATPEQAQAEWEFEKARAEWDAYQQAQESYELMAEQGEVPH